MEYKVCSWEYFLDEMKTYELSIIMDNLNYCLRNDWEMTREVMWSNLAPWSKKKLKPSEILKLPWDDKDNKNQPKPIEVTEHVRKELTKKAEARRKALMASGAL